MIPKPSKSMSLGSTEIAKCITVYVVKYKKKYSKQYNHRLIVFVLKLEILGVFISCTPHIIIYGELNAFSINALGNVKHFFVRHTYNYHSILQ